MPLPDVQDTLTAFAGKSHTELLRAYAIYRMINVAPLVSVGTRMASRMLNAGLAWPVTVGMRPTIYSVFCGGASLEDTIRLVKHNYQFGVGTILDYGVEGKGTEADFERTAEEVMRAIDFAADNPAVRFVSSKFTGLLRFELLEKMHAGEILSKEEQEEYNRCAERIHGICAHAATKGVSLLVDAEESWIQDPLDKLVTGLMQQYNMERPVIYNTIQLYLQDRLPYFRQAVALASSEGYIYAAKLVRGRIWKKKRKGQKRWVTPTPYNRTRQLQTGTLMLR